jgi:cell pole-organizing protein PopZ
MEEILASIRRIIADDDNLPGVRREDRRADHVDLDARLSARNAYPAPVLDRRRDEPRLSHIVDAQAGFQAPGDVRLLRGAACNPEHEPEGATLEIRKTSSENGSVADRQDANVEIPDVAPESPLLSTKSAETVASQFQALAAGVALSESDILDKCVQEMLRPMLREWLDENLPSLVERLVRAEIERLARAKSHLSPSSSKPV